MTNGLDFKPAPTHVICYNSNLCLSLTITILAMITTTMTVIDESESQYEKSEKHCRCLIVKKKLCHKSPDFHDGYGGAFDCDNCDDNQECTITEKSNTKSEFNHCISTERQMGEMWD